MTADERAAADNALDVEWERITTENEQPATATEPPEQSQTQEAELSKEPLGSPPPVFFVDWNTAQHDFDMNLYKDRDKIGYNKDGVFVYDKL